jgi:hypothetical protein
MGVRCTPIFYTTQAVFAPGRYELFYERHIMTIYGTLADSPDRGAALSDPRLAASGAGSAQLPMQGPDTLAWAMAQSSALAKIKVFSSMAKAINDQQ